MEATVCFACTVFMCMCVCGGVCNVCVIHVFVAVCVCVCVWGSTVRLHGVHVAASCSVVCVVVLRVFI